MNNLLELNEKLFNSTQYTKWFFTNDDFLELTNHQRLKKYNIDLAKKFPGMGRSSGCIFYVFSDLFF